MKYGNGIGFAFWKIADNSWNYISFGEDLVIFNSNGFYLGQTNKQTKKYATKQKMSAEIHFPLP